MKKVLLILFWWLILNTIPVYSALQQKLESSSLTADSDSEELRKTTRQDFVNIIGYPASPNAPTSWMREKIDAAIKYHREKETIPSPAPAVIIHPAAPGLSDEDNRLLLIHSIIHKAIERNNEDSTSLITPSLRRTLFAKHIPNLVKLPLFAGKSVDQLTKNQELIPQMSDFLIAIEYQSALTAAKSHEDRNKR